MYKKVVCIVHNSMQFVLLTWEKCHVVVTSVYFSFLAGTQGHKVKEEYYYDSDEDLNKKFLARKEGGDIVQRIFLSLQM